MPRFAIARKDLEQPLLDPGTYTCRLDTAKLGESKNKNPKMTLMWTVIGTEPPAGQKFPDSITLIPEAFWKLNMLFQALKYNMDDDGFNTEELQGREARLIVTHQTGDDNVTRVQVAQYLPL